jgi:type IV secretion system protein VirD4
MRLKKTPYWNRPEFQGRYNRNPYHEKEIRAALGTGAKVIWGRLVYIASWWLTPHPVAALLIAGTVIIGVMRLF